MAASESKLFARAGKVFRIVSLIKHFFGQITEASPAIAICLRGRKETITVHKSCTAHLSSLPLK